MSYVFVTFMQKLSPEQAKAILAELRKRIPDSQIIFTPKPPAGRKVIWNINNETVIITYPSKSSGQGQEQDQGQGFTLRDLLKTKNPKKA